MQLSISHSYIFQIIITITTLILPSKQNKGQEKIQEKFFVFPEFDYVESAKNEIAWREWEAACEQTPVCLGIVNSMDKTKCMRKCISPSCYNDIYAFDELEEGEIDIRFHSFKGCFNTRIARKRI